MRIAPDRLRQLVSQILTRGGSEPAEAQLVAGHLVDANLAGHDSHKMGLTPRRAQPPTSRRASGL